VHLRPHGGARGGKQAATISGHYAAQTENERDGEQQPRLDEPRRGGANVEFFGQSEPKKEKLEGLKNIFGEAYGGFP